MAQGPNIVNQPKRAFANIATATTDGSVVAAVAGKKIRVLAVSVTTGATATSTTFNTKPTGAGTAISATFTLGANGSKEMAFNPTGWFETNAGEGLSATTSAAGATTGIHVVYVEA